VNWGIWAVLWCKRNLGCPEYHVLPGGENVSPSDKWGNRAKCCFNWLYACWILWG